MNDDPFGRVPQYHELFNHILSAIRELGGSAALAELELKVADAMHLEDAVVDLPHVRNRGNVDEINTSSSEFAYRLRWGLTYLKKAGYVTNSTRGVWSLTELGKTPTTLDPREIVATVRGQSQGTSASAGGTLPTEPDLHDPNDEDSVEQAWSDKVLSLLLAIAPAAFERLAQRLLREIGFDEVDVLGRSGDGGIDGRGILRLNEVISMAVVFQCKRYSGTVGPDAIRDFRGGMEGRADRGLVITTANFTSGAVKEANRDGAMPIDVIDGARLVQLLKKYSLGVATLERVVEAVTVSEEWFNSL
jgi:restriction system protein